MCKTFFRVLYFLVLGCLSLAVVSSNLKHKLPTDLEEPILVPEPLKPVAPQKVFPLKTARLPDSQSKVHVEPLDLSAMSRYNLNNEQLWEEIHSSYDRPEDLLLPARNVKGNDETYFLSSMGAAMNYSVNSKKWKIMWPMRRHPEVKEVLGFLCATNRTLEGLSPELSMYALTWCDTMNKLDIKRSESRTDENRADRGKGNENRADGGKGNETTDGGKRNETAVRVNRSNGQVLRKNNDQKNLSSDALPVKRHPIPSKDDSHHTDHSMNTEKTGENKPGTEESSQEPSFSTETRQGALTPEPSFSTETRQGALTPEPSFPKYSNQSTVQNIGVYKLNPAPILSVEKNQSTVNSPGVDELSPEPILSNARNQGKLHNLRTDELRTEPSLSKEINQGTVQNLGVDESSSEPILSNERIQGAEHSLIVDELSTTPNSFKGDQDTTSGSSIKFRWSKNHTLGNVEIDIIVDKTERARKTKRDSKFDEHSFGELSHKEATGKDTQELTGLKRVKKGLSEEVLGFDDPAESEGAVKQGAAVDDPSSYLQFNKDQPTQVNTLYPPGAVTDTTVESGELTDLGVMVTGAAGGVTQYFNDATPFQLKGAMPATTIKNEEYREYGSKEGDKGNQLMDDADTTPKPQESGTLSLTLGTNKERGENASEEDEASDSLDDDGKRGDAITTTKSQVSGKRSVTFQLSTSK